MTTNTRTLIQEVYFDLVDILNGQTYRQLGYDDKGDFLREQIAKITQIAAKIKPLEGEY